MAEPQDFTKRLDVLKRGRSNFDTLWTQVQEVTWPDGDTFLNTRSPGEKTTQHVYEGTATSALEKFASAMESFLIPRHLRWHGLRASSDELNEEKEVKAFFENAVKRLFKTRERPAARFYGQMGENFKSIGAYGNGCMFVDEAPSGVGIRYRHIPIGRAWIEVDYHGNVDTIYYEYKLTAKAAAQKWPHAVPEKAAKALENGKDFAEFTYLHVVQPNDPTNIDPESVNPEGMPYHAWDVSIQDKAIIPQVGGEEFGGFFEFPYIWSRFTLNPTEIYGRGPGMMALPDVLTLQQMEKTFLRSGHKVADPPLLVAHDGRMGRGRRQIRLSAGGLNYGAVDESGRAKIIPLQTGARLDMTESMMDRKRDAIFDAYFVKLFDILERDRVEMTATEVIERGKEKGQLITPVVGRQQSELLGPMIQRELGILQRQGQIPDLPAALVEAQGSYEIEYDTLATRLQQSDEVSSYQQLVALFMPQIELNPLLAEVLNAEDAMRAFGEVMGIRSTLFKSQKEMAQIREEQAQQAQAAQMTEAAPKLAQAAKTASEIPDAEGGV